LLHILASREHVLLRLPTTQIEVTWLNYAVLQLGNELGGSKSSLLGIAEPDENGKVLIGISADVTLEELAVHWGEDSRWKVIQHSTS